MKFLIIYFTGTGNTLRVVNTIKNNLKEHDVDIVDVISNDIKDVSNYDYLIISYPIYAFNTPKPVIDYVKKINKLSTTKRCLIMKQSGEYLFWNNASSLKLISLLKRRNIIVTNEYHYLMPYSLIFRHSDFMAFRMDQIMSNLVPIDLKDFIDNKPHHLKRFFFDRPFAFIFRIQQVAGRSNGKRYKIDANKCIKCMRCVNECPINNIEYIEDKFLFKNKCLMCMRCVMNCPSDAFNIGLFNSWKVNKPYTFIEAPYQEEIKPNYCKKAYMRYFQEAEEKIRKHQEF